MKRPYRAASGAVHLIGNLAPEEQSGVSKSTMSMLFLNYCTVPTSCIFSFTLTQVKIIKIKCCEKRKFGLTLPRSVLVVFNEPCQTKVCHFTHQAVSHQNVGSTQVSVDVVHPFHVGHTCCNLEQVNQRGRRFYNKYKYCKVFSEAELVVLPEQPCLLAEAGEASFLLPLSGNPVSYL